MVLDTVVGWNQAPMTLTEGEWHCAIDIEDGWLAYRLVIDGVPYYKPGKQIRHTPLAKMGSFKVLRVDVRAHYSVGIDVGF